MNAPAVTLQVAQRFQRLRRRYLVVHIGTTLLLTIAAILFVWLALAVSDYHGEWPATWRNVLLVVGIAVIATGCSYRLYRIGVDTRQRLFVGRLEQRFKDFGQRIRTVLETAEGRLTGPGEMLSALGHQTLGRWEIATPSQMLPLRTTMASGVVCTGLSLAAAGVFGIGGDWRIAMQRALGGDLAYTTMAVTPGDAKVLEGSPVNVSLELSGRTDRDVLLRYRPLPLAGDESEDPDASDTVQWIESELLPDEPQQEQPRKARRATFTAALGRASEAIEYQFVTSIGTSPMHRIDIQPLIEVERIETHVEPPEYTRLQTRSFTVADVTVLERSKVTVTIQTNHPLHRAELHTGTKPRGLQPVALAAGEDPTLWTFDLPSDESLHWRFSGNGADDVPMTPLQGRLRVRRDVAPDLAWRDPPDEIRVHTLAEVPLRVQVGDDYGISQCGIVFQLGGSDEFILADWAADQGTGDAVTTRVKLEDILPLESLGLSQRDYISYYAFAVDNRADNPQRAVSDIRYIDIRPLRQFYAEIEPEPNGGGGGGGPVVVQLDELIRRERFLINRTRRLTRSDGSDLAIRLGTIDRMVENQSELAGLTRFLTEFLVSRGNDDVEALSQAEASMLQAADSLAAGGFDLALAQEQDALRSLAEARRGLEIFLLKNATPQQQRAMQRFARQMQQKLRRDRPETEQEIADSLKRIANEQAEVGRLAKRLAAQPKSGNGKGRNGSGQTKPGEGDDSAEQGEPDATAGAETDSPGANGSAEDQPSNEPASDEPTGEANAPPRDDPGSQPSDELMANGPNADDLLAKQIDLLERLEAIKEQLAERLGESSLMERRMQEAQEQMDQLATGARRGEWDALSGGSQPTAELLREMGLQLDALAATEAVARVSSLRDMTASLSGLEQQRYQQRRIERRRDQQEGDEQHGGGNQDTPGSSSEPFGSDDEQLDPEQLLALETRMRRRTETIEDVLKAPVQPGDVETSEVNDYLQRFLEENQFLELLAATRQAVQRPSSAPVVGSDPVDDRQPVETPSDQSDRGLQRASDYAQAAVRLEELYRQLITPRLAQLRKLEQRAHQLAQQMAGTGGAGKPAEPESEMKAELQQLQRQLEREGLEQLAKQLDQDAEAGQAAGEEPAGEQGSGGKDQNAVMSSGGEYSPTGNNLPRARLLLVVKELRAKIQEMILLEISADRDAPVPAQYRAAVDRYFRSIAGGAEANDLGDGR